MELRAGISLAAIEQWGENVGGGGQTVSLPISFEVAFTAVVSADSSWCNASCHITTTTITTMNYQSNRPDIAQAGPVQWLAIGIQPQWGFTVFDPVYYKNVNFTLPLSVNGTFCAFSTGYDAKGSTFLWHSMSHFNNVNVGVTGFVFDSRYTFTGLGYLAVCWQKQWGFIARNANTTFTFPIMFTTLYAAMRTAYGVSGRDPSWDEIAIPSATVKQINLGSCYWASYVIAIGI